MESIKKLLFDKDVSESQKIIETFQNKLNKSSVEFISEKIIQTDKYKADKIKIKNNVFNELEFFNTNNPEDESIFDKVNRCHTVGGKKVLKKIIKTPTDNITKLKKRIDLLENVEKIYNSHRVHLDFELNKIAENETAVLNWLYNRDKKIDNIFDNIYFKNIVLKKLNDYSLPLTISNLYKMILLPLSTFAIPAIYIFVPYYILRVKLKMKMSFSKYINMIVKNVIFNKNLSKYHSLTFLITFLVYLYNLINTLVLSKLTYDIIHIIHTNINKIVQTVYSIQRIKELFKKVLENENIDCFDYKYNNIDLNIKSNMFVLFGKSLVLNKKLEKDEEFKNDIVVLINDIYHLETLISIVKLRNHKDMCIPIYLESDVPKCYIKNGYHPVLGNRSVKNSLMMNQNNIILTGPNAGGKSTYLKSIMANVILSQTLCLSFANTCALTPFYFINTQINIPDRNGKESLFQAEMNRTKNNIDNIEKYENDKFSFVIMDEIFSSTNPLEGISGSYAICKKLSSYKNVLIIIATHYSLLTELEKETNFVNYCVKVNDDYSYDYKIKKGISNQSIALEMLKNEGFSSDIIDKAIEIKNKIKITKED